MKARQRLTIFLTLIACGIAIAIFGLVALGRFVAHPVYAQRPTVSKLEVPHAEELSMLQPEPVPSPAPTPASSNNSASSNNKHDNRKHNKKHH